MGRTPPKEGKLLYHLTTMNNIENILKLGLLPRSELVAKGLVFDDTANQDILLRRKEQALDEYVPFHFFIKNPYDGAQFKKHPETDFVYITIYRKFLENSDKGFIIPKHPLSEAHHTLEVIPYAQGFDKIDWNMLVLRDYSNQECKRACMCEALYKGIVPRKAFCGIKVKTLENKQKIDIIARKFGLECPIDLAETWF